MRKMAIRRSTVRLFVLILFYVLYLVLGASVFSAVEGPKETELIKELRSSRDEFLRDYSCISDEKLEALVEAVVKAHSKGVSISKNSSNELNWSFGQSLFFAASVLTTIGYGHVTPLSEGGKIFCIVYAAIGIPLTLIFFTASVERLMVLTSALLRLLMTRLSHLYRVIHLRLIHLSIIFSFILIFVFIIPAAIFMAIESQWNFLDSFYYCFISMTTIGLGDYIPGDDPNQSNRLVYKIGITVYLFVGLILMLLMVANVYDVPELNLGHYFYMRNDPILQGEEKRLNQPNTSRGIEADQLRSAYNTTSETANKSYQKDISPYEDKTQLVTAGE